MKKLMMLSGVSFIVCLISLTTFAFVAPSIALMVIGIIALAVSLASVNALIERD